MNRPYKLELTYISDDLFTIGALNIRPKWLIGGTIRSLVRGLSTEIWIMVLEEERYLHYLHPICIPITGESEMKDICKVVGSQVSLRVLQRWIEGHITCESHVSRDIWGLECPNHVNKCLLLAEAREDGFPSMYARLEAKGARITEQICGLIVGPREWSGYGSRSPSEPEPAGHN